MGTNQTGRTTYFTVGRDSKTGVFVERPAKGASTKVMGKTVFETAVRSANGVFREVSGGSQKPSSLHGKK